MTHRNSASNRNNNGCAINNEFFLVAHSLINRIRNAMTSDSSSAFLNCERALTLYCHGRLYRFYSDKDKRETLAAKGLKTTGHFFHS